MSQKLTTPVLEYGSLKKIVCNWFYDGTCPHSQDHLDSTGVMSLLLQTPHRKKMLTLREIARTRKKQMWSRTSVAVTVVFYRQKVSNK